LERNASNTYDVVSIGVGPSSLFALDELRDSVAHHGLTALCITRGSVAEKGGFLNDCKSNYTPDIGFQLERFNWDYADVMRFLAHYYQTLERHVEGELPFTNNNYDGVSVLYDRCQAADIKLVACQQAHVGTDRAKDMAISIQDELQKAGVEFRYRTEVERFEKDADGYFKIETTNGVVFSRYLIAGPGRNGSQWLTEQADALGLPYSSNGLDLGIRIEGLSDWFDPITDLLYDPKLYFNTRLKGPGDWFDIVSRTFCTNPRGRIVADVCKKTGVKGVNGEADMHEKTNRTNMAIVASVRHLGDVDYRAMGVDLAKRTLSGRNGRKYQRWEDFLAQRVTTRSGLDNNSVNDGKNHGFRVPGNFHDGVYPWYVVEALKTTIEGLGKLSPAIVSPDLLMIGPELKLYDNFFHRRESGFENAVMDGLFLVGDGSGATRAQTGAAYDGYMAACKIKEKEQLRTRDLRDLVSRDVLDNMLHMARLPGLKLDDVLRKRVA
jgi:uncharacterized protein